MSVYFVKKKVLSNAINFYWGYYYDYCEIVKSCYNNVSIHFRRHT